MMSSAKMVLITLTFQKKLITIINVYYIFSFCCHSVGCYAESLSVHCRAIGMCFYSVDLVYQSSMDGKTCQLVWVCVGWVFHRVLLNINTPAELGSDKTLSNHIFSDRLLIEFSEQQLIHYVSFETSTGRTTFSGNTLPIIQGLCILLSRR